MKKEAIISALLLVSPSSHLQAQDISVAREVVKMQRQELVDMVFVSNNTDVKEFWEQDLSGEWSPMTFRYHYRISFIKSDDTYSYQNAEGEWIYEGKGGLEYEAVVEAVTPEGRVLHDYLESHYVKRMDENTFKLFDCDSTKTCQESGYNIVFHIFDTPNGKLMKFKQSSEKNNMAVNMSKEYNQVK